MSLISTLHFIDLLIIVSKLRITYNTSPVEVETRAWLEPYGWGAVSNPAVGNVGVVSSHVCIEHVRR